MRLETIQEAIVVSMKTHSTIEVETLRGVVAAVKKAAIDKKCEITEELVDEILLKEKKIIQEMIDTCPKDRNDLLMKYELKMDIINDFAPQLIVEPENIHFLITSILAKANIDPQSVNKGIIMKTVMPVLKGKVDMKIANQVIDKLMR